MAQVIQNENLSIKDSSSCLWKNKFKALSMIIMRCFIIKFLKLIYDKGSRPELPSQYWIHRVRLMFRGEDPRVFARRVVDAFRLRKNTEALVRYSLYVDCMPMEGVGELDQASLKRMIEASRDVRGLKGDKR